MTIKYILEKYKNWVIGITLFVIIAVVLYLIFRSSQEGYNQIIMYGADWCHYCQKQKEYFKKKSINYTFVDCTKTQCPAFVKGFPTLNVDGNIKSGYSEI